MRFHALVSHMSIADGYTPAMICLV